MEAFKAMPPEWTRLVLFILPEEEKLRTLNVDYEKRLAALSAAQREKLRRIEEICKQAAALPILDTRTDDEILGYNDKGTFD